MSLTDRPLVWTTHGNIPVDSLEYKTQWEDTPDYVKFVEQYWLGEELVKESAHVYSRKGLSLEGIAASL